MSQSGGSVEYLYAEHPRLKDKLIDVMTAWHDYDTNYATLDNISDVTIKGHANSMNDVVTNNIKKYIEDSATKFVYGFDDEVDRNTWISNCVANFDNLNKYNQASTTPGEPGNDVGTSTVASAAIDIPIYTNIYTKAKALKTKATDLFNERKSNEMVYIIAPLIKVPLNYANPNEMISIAPDCHYGIDYILNYYNWYIEHEIENANALKSSEFLNFARKASELMQNIWMAKLKGNKDGSKTPDLDYDGMAQGSHVGSYYEAHFKEGVYKSVLIKYTNNVGTGNDVTAEITYSDLLNSIGKNMQDRYVLHYIVTFPVNDIVTLTNNPAFKFIKFEKKPLAVENTAKFDAVWVNRSNVAATTGTFDQINNVFLTKRYDFYSQTHFGYGDIYSDTTGIVSAVRGHDNPPVSVSDRNAITTVFKDIFDEDKSNLTDVIIINIKNAPNLNAGVALLPDAPFGVNTNVKKMVVNKIKQEASINDLATWKNYLKSLYDPADDPTTKLHRKVTKLLIDLNPGTKPDSIQMVLEHYFHVFMSGVKKIPEDFIKVEKAKREYENSKVVSKEESKTSSKILEKKSKEKKDDLKKRHLEQGVESSINNIKNTLSEVGMTMSMVGETSDALKRKKEEERIVNEEVENKIKIMEQIRGEDEDKFYGSFEKGNTSDIKPVNEAAGAEKVKAMETEIYQGKPSSSIHDSSFSTDEDREEEQQIREIGRMATDILVQRREQIEGSTGVKIVDQGIDFGSQIDDGFLHFRPKIVKENKKMIPYTPAKQLVETTEYVKNATERAKEWTEATTRLNIYETKFYAKDKIYVGGK